jgi:predicted protein tyrosine phosphatase
MDLIITGIIGAAKHVPSKPTYVIRINAGVVPFDDFDRRILSSHELYTVVEYTFDDIWPDMVWTDNPRAVMFNESIAERVLREFQTDGLDKEALLVHCSRGKNRSPAVGIALNGVFSLGHDSDALKERYPDANWYVYNTLVKVAKRIL